MGYRLEPLVSVNRVALAWIQGLAVAVAMGGCVVFTPVTTSTYNPDCAGIERHMKLKAHQIEVLVGCHNQGCVEALVLAGVVSASTLVVSGTVVLIGDIVYWLEAKANCQPGNPF